MKVTLEGTQRIIALRELHQSRFHAGLMEGLPTEQPIELSGRYPFGTPAKLPSIARVGDFYSAPIAHDPESDGSCLTIVWFQESFALPIDPEVLTASQRLDWDRLAKPYQC